MQNTVVFETVFEEYINKHGKAFTICKSSPHDSIKKLIEEQYFEYAFLMRLVDTVMPSASMLNDVMKRRAVEIGVPDHEGKNNALQKLKLNNALKKVN